MHLAIRALAAIGSLALALNVTSTAHAEDTAKGAITKALTESSPNGAPDTAPLTELARLADPISGGVYKASFAEKAAIEIPLNPTGRVQITSRNGSTISVGLPFSKSAKAALAIADGALVFDNQNGSDTAVLAKTDGSLQIATVLTAQDAPTNYSYDLALPSGVKVTLNSDGGVVFLGANGRYLGGVAPAWARDARGATIPTHYEIAGSTLIQVVEHKNLPYAYPIVADPWFGFDLIDYTVWTATNPWSPTLSVYPTTWGRAVSFATTYPFSSGLIAITDQLSLNAAWSETLSKTARTGHPNPDTPTMYAQFECHYFWVSKRTPNKVSWNLDSRRAYAGMATQFTANCNVQ
jgi:hypothetical protein